MLRSRTRLLEPYPDMFCMFVHVSLRPPPPFTFIMAPGFMIKLSGFNLILLSVFFWVAPSVCSATETDRVFSVCCWFCWTHLGSVSGCFSSSRAGLSIWAHLVALFAHFFSRCDANVAAVRLVQGALCGSGHSKDIKDYN